MFPEAQKGTDDLTYAKVSFRTYNVRYDSNAPASAGTMNTPSRCIGAKTETLYNKTRKYRPGSGVVNPVIHFRNEGTCTEAPYTEAMGLYWNKWYHMCGVGGHVAAYVQQQNSLSPLSDVSPSSAELMALAKAIEKTTEPKAWVGVTVGEMPETISMFRDPIRKMAHEGREFKKLIPRNVRNFSKAAANAWLQVRYGIMPLLGEIDTYRNLVNNGINREVSSLLKEKAGWKSPNFSSTGSFSKRFVYGGYIHGTESQNKGTVVSATAYYRRTRTCSVSNLGLDFSALPATLWELVPYSFVLDWFVDVGGWLQRLTPTNSVEQVSNCLSLMSYEESATTTTGYSYQEIPSERFPVSPCHSAFKFRRTAYHRNVNLSLPAVPLVNYRALGLARQVDSVLLAFQRASNLFTRR